ncbi:hypothetical protein P280DRAFT_330259 [Massarina eburnea CBS 473.64]|uniref:Uncharacterized protein n=1 Tax=Massarina eburnea CBS 473.64 TaxID=1395130 RepID=A0A6A6S021_9PLEO|nr:hypothetical protein P280DRAFT_330259 [Massarina eburnea CBS 473.64]
MLLVKISLCLLLLISLPTKTVKRLASHRTTAAKRLRRSACHKSSLPTAVLRNAFEDRGTAGLCSASDESEERPGPLSGAESEACGETGSQQKEPISAFRNRQTEAVRVWGPQTCAICGRFQFMLGQYETHPSDVSVTGLSVYASVRSTSRSDTHPSSIKLERVGEAVRFRNASLVEQSTLHMHTHVAFSAGIGIQRYKGSKG